MVLVPRLSSTAPQVFPIHTYTCVVLCILVNKGELTGVLCADAPLLTIIASKTFIPIPLQRVRASSVVSGRRKTIRSLREPWSISLVSFLKPSSYVVWFVRMRSISWPVQCCCPVYTPFKYNFPVQVERFQTNTTCVQIFAWMSLDYDRKSTII